jgi:hypothetical protein
LRGSTGNNFVGSDDDVVEPLVELTDDVTSAIRRQLGIEDAGVDAEQVWRRITVDYRNRRIRGAVV